MSETLNGLYQLILSRKENPPPNSYTAKLFAAGDVEIAKKVGEEAIEVIVASYAQRDPKTVGLDPSREKQFVFVGLPERLVGCTCR